MRCDATQRARAAEKDKSHLENEQGDVAKLREDVERLTAGNEDLKEQVDTAQALEEMVEELTERNLELIEKAGIMEEQVEELEEYVLVLMKLLYEPTLYWTLAGGGAGGARHLERCEVIVIDVPHSVLLPLCLISLHMCRYLCHE